LGALAGYHTAVGEARSHEIYRARWIVPVGRPPIEGGEVVVREGAILSVGRQSLPASGKREDNIHDLGEAVLFPSPVNAHTHLEWSHLEGGAPKGPPFTGWVRALLASPRPEAKDQLAAAERAARGCLASGTFSVGNFSASLAEAPIMIEAGLGGSIFQELIGLPASRAEPLEREARQWREVSARNPQAIGLPVFPAPHGPHTVSRELLLRLAAELVHGGRLALHVAESTEELEFLRTGLGPFREIHEARGGWDGSWTPPATTPVRYLDSLGLLTPRTLAVHCVHVDGGEIRLLVRRGTSVALCPRSNRWTGAGVAPLPSLLQAGVNCALGTDSLASNSDLDMAAELAAARETWPSVSPAELVRMATLGGALALGLHGRELGRGELSPGSRALMAFAEIPQGALGASDPCAILCGDHGAVRFRKAPLSGAPRAAAPFSEERKNKPQEHKES